MVAAAKKATSTVLFSIFIARFLSLSIWPPARLGTPRQLNLLIQKLRLQKCRAPVGTVDMGMTVGAGLRLRSRFGAVDGSARGRAMALRAHRVHWLLEESGILGTVRAVACDATLGLDRSVLVGERPAHLGVTLRANQVDSGREVLARGLGRVDDLGGVAARGDVRASCAMAGFTRVT